jgi:phosphoserine phosphatase RsbU/P
MLPRTSGFVVLFTALSASVAGLLCHGQQAQPSEVGRYHLGDDAHWADPRFDDSAWPLAEHGQWPMPPFNSDGFIWIRFHIPVRADASGPLAVRSMQSYAGELILADEIYVNGALTAREGSLPPHVLLDPQWDMVSDLPASATTPGKTAVVALRVWVPPWVRIKIAAGALHISIGESSYLLVAQQAAQWAFLYANGLDIVLNTGIAILGFGMLIAWRWTGEGNLRLVASVMIWQALGLLAWNPTLERPPVLLAVAAVVVPIALFELALVELNWTVHRLRAPALKVLCQAAPVVWCLGNVIIAAMTAPGTIAFWSGLAVFVGALAWSLALITVGVWAIWARKTNPLIALALLANPLIALLTDGVHMLPYGVTVGPFHEHTIAFTTFVLDVALFILLGQNAWKAWRARDELRVEFEAAREIQEQMVAPAMDAPGFSLESAYMPSKQVGGDFFRTLPEADGSVMIVVGDVSGKGLKAAMTVSAIMGALRDYPSRQPSEVLAHLNRALYGQIGGFVTCCVALVTVDGTMTLANAGNPPVYCNGEELAVEPALPLGLLAEISYAETRYRLALGDQLTFVSDGVVEATNPGRELYGFERTRAISNQPANAIAQAAARFGQEDDITVVTLTRESIGASASKQFSGASIVV